MPAGNLHKIEDWFEFDDAGAGHSVITARLLNYTLDGQKSAARYRWNFRPRAAEAPNDFTNLFALADAVATDVPGPEPYTSSALALMNVPQWMRVFALQHMAGNWDSYGYRRGKNMYTYKPQDSRWELLLWDVQLVFGKSSDSASQYLFDLGNPDATDQYEPMIARMYGHPPFVREFWAALGDLVNGPMLPENYSPIMDARFAALRANDVNVQEPSSLKNWINARRAYILSQFPQADVLRRRAAIFQLLQQQRRVDRHRPDRRRHGGRQRHRVSADLDEHHQLEPPRAARRRNECPCHPGAGPEWKRACRRDQHGQLHRRGAGARGRGGVQ